MASKSPSTSRPSIFDMTGRAKWDAWTAVGKKYERPEEVEQRYLEIARTLGWTEQTKVPEPKTPSTDKDIWDKDEVSHASSGGGGLAVAVSSMAPPPKVIDNSIHGIALSNDITGLKEILEAHPETDLNVLDEFVSNEYISITRTVFQTQFHRDMLQYILPATEEM